MKLTLTAQQETYKARVAKWFDANLPSSWSLWDGTPADDVRWGEVNDAWELKLAQGGFIGISWPKEFGGQGLTMIEHYLFSEEYGRRCAPDGSNTIGRELTAPLLLHAGTDAQKKRFLPAIARGEETWCQAFSEPNAGSDLASLSTRAVWRDGAWYLSGHKTWSSYARYAKWCLLLGRTSVEDKPNKGLTLFLVPLQAPGVTARPIRQASGRSLFSEIFFDEVRVSPDSVVGAPGTGWKVAENVLNAERATTRLYKVARFESELRTLAKMLKDRGTRPSMHDRSDAIQKFGQVIAELVALRAVNLQTVSRLASSENLGPESSIVKLLWSRAHQALTHLGMEILEDSVPQVGTEDGIDEALIDLYMHSRAETIFAGSTEIQQMIIANRVLSLPR